MGENGYAKVNGDTLSIIEEPGETQDKGEQFKKVK